ncbi:MAG: hypothetical protein U5P41_07240 [Gammaproteobacteria bacterium]|nr:hypothetical protein [Gammaproteobacteria bacterium]
MPAHDLTVFTFLWDGWRALYDARHVNALHRMVTAHLSIPHRFVCVTDQPAGIECETWPLWDEPALADRPSHHDSYRRLQLFSPWAAATFGPGWALLLDLDCLVLDELAPLITWDDFRGLKGAVCTYNGSMWLHRLGSRPQVYETFSGDGMRAALTRTSKRKPWRGSDQVWISYCLPGGPFYGNPDGVYRWEGKARVGKRIPDAARILFFPGNYERKPWAPEFARKFPDVHRRYMDWFGGPA